MAITSAFEKFEVQAWPHRFQAELHLDRICGGTPSDPKVAEGWLKKNLGAEGPRLEQMIIEVMTERAISRDEAVKAVNDLKHLNGFKRNEAGLYVEGRHVKAAIKEAANVAAAAGKLPTRSWGVTNKGLMGFVAEHIVVVEDQIPLGVTEPSGVNQKFVHTWQGNGISYEEYVENVDIKFEVRSDWPFTEEQWAMIWLTGGQQGLGASRSQGNGRYVITKWEPVA